MAGDVMFEDRDGSGSIGTGAGTVDDPGDMMIIGNTTPRYSYSFRIEASWNGFDISAFFQGVGKRDWYPTANKDDIYGANQFWQLYGYTIPSFITYDFMDDVWSEQNPGDVYKRQGGLHDQFDGALAADFEDDARVGALRHVGITFEQVGICLLYTSNRALRRAWG